MQYDDIEDVLSELNIVEQTILEAWLQCAYLKSRAYGHTATAGEMRELIGDLARSAPYMEGDSRG